jgi:hypothetical protein
MGHDHKPSMKLCWTQDKLYRILFYSSVMSCDRLLTILKYLHWRTIITHQHKIGKIPIMTDYEKSENQVGRASLYYNIIQGHTSDLGKLRTKKHSVNAATWI